MHDFTGQPTTDGTVLPQAPVEPQAQQAGIPHPHNAAWRYRFHPLRWQFVPDAPGGPTDAKGQPTGEWFPILGTRVLSPGVGGVDKDGSTMYARVEDLRLGWQELPMSWGPLQLDGSRRYVDAYPTRAGPGKHHHCSVWERPRYFRDRVLESRLDQRGYYDWLRELIASGKLPEPGEPAIRLAVDVQRKKYDSAASKTTVRHNGDAKAELEAAKLRAMEATLPAGLDHSMVTEASGPMAPILPDDDDE